MHSSQGAILQLHPSEKNKSFSCWGQLGHLRRLWWLLRIPCLSRAAAVVLARKAIRNPCHLQSTASYRSISDTERERIASWPFGQPPRTSTDLSSTEQWPPFKRHQVILGQIRSNISTGSPLREGAVVEAGGNSQPFSLCCRWDFGKLSGHSLRAERGSRAGFNPRSLKEKAALSLHWHQASEVRDRAVLCRMLAHAQLFWDFPVQKLFCQRCCQIYHQLCMWNSAHASPTYCGSS